jgi:hypothetical protein
MTEGRRGGIVEQAFEAGISCVLGGKANLDDERESEEEAELRRLLLRQLIEHSPATRYMHRGAMSRAALQPLIQANLTRRPGASWGSYQPGRRRAISARISTISLKRSSGASRVRPARNRASKAWRPSPSTAGDVTDLE